MKEKRGKKKRKSNPQSRTHTYIYIKEDYVFKKNTKNLSFFLKKHFRCNYSHTFYPNAGNKH